VSPPRQKRLGEILVESGAITAAQCAEALVEQRQSGRQLGEILVDKGFADESALLKALAQQSGLPHVWLRRGLVDPKAVGTVPQEKARLYGVMPMFKVLDTLTLAVADPNQLPAFDDLQKTTGCRIQLVLSRRSDIQAAIDEYYAKDVRLDDFITSLDDNAIQLVENRTEERYENIAELAGESPIVNLVNLIILKAVKEGASDIHIEPNRGKLRIRYRLDGVLYEVMTPKLELHPAIVSRLKIMANLDIAEHRLPQDGRIQVYLEGRLVDLRFSSMPSIFGEKVVLRILDRAGAILDIDRLGLGTATLAAMRDVLRKPYGLLLVTGPTGSGKTTTLYAALAMLNTLEKSIVTIEDPVEYQLDIVNQNQVNPPIGLTFATILKHALRQDPDILMIGEIRERDTADIAIQAALTGHLVLSTLHTNDAPSAISRLLDMGVEPFRISSSLLAVVAQRLLRTLCPDCKAPYYPSLDELRALGFEAHDGVRLYRAVGCDRCYDSGYRGRVGIYEMLSVDRELQALVLERPSIDALRRHRAADRLPTLYEEGREKVLAGLTSMEELARVVYVD
jgi:type IV pilus assembly protein PilB